MTGRELFLYPRPRRLEFNGEGPPTSSPARTERDSQLGPEAFLIDIDESDVFVRASDDAGMRYGLALLDSIREQSGESLPAVHIEDSPDFAVRGYLLDISRDRVPTRETLERLIGLMTRARLNHLELYTEHTFAYPGHEQVWREASPMRPGDIVWLDARCREAGIELVPNQACFGHMARWLQHEAYASRAEAPGGVEIMPGAVLPASTLAPTPDNADFVLGLLAELLPHFSSRRVNINCDETFELGKGVSAARAAEIGKSAVYLEHVSRIIGPLVADGREVLMWADILCQDPSSAQGLPTGTVPIAWWYEAPLAEGETRELPGFVVDFAHDLGIGLRTRGFGTHVEPLASSGRPFWVAPGTSSWTSLVGRIDNARANMLDAADVGRIHGSPGFLITDWGDEGHIQPPAISFGPLLYGGAVSWNAEANRDLDMGTILDRIAFADPSGALGGAVVDIGLVWRETGQTPFNGSPLHSAIVDGSVGLATGTPDGAKLTSVVERLGAAIKAIDASSPQCSDAALVKRELSTAAGLARQGAWRILESLGAAVPAGRHDELAALIEAQRAVWLARARPGGLDDSIGRLERSLTRRS